MARSRKRRGPAIGDAAFAPREAPGAAPERPRRLRGAAAEDAARASLEPLAPGERPRAVTVAAIVATLAAPANVIALFVAGGDPTAAETRFTLLQCLVLGVAAYGLWGSRYWAVLGFQALLAITCVVGASAVALAGNATAVAFGLLLVLAAGTLFWFLIRAMARIQMPRRPGA